MVSGKLTVLCENVVFREMTADNEQKLNFEGGDKWIRNPETLFKLPNYIISNVKYRSYKNSKHAEH